MEFKNTKAYVWKEKFAIVKSAKCLDGAFANIVDKDEITVIIDGSKVDVNLDNIIESDGGWKIITLDVKFSFDVVGVTAKISTALAEANVSLMPIAAFSRDHFLVKDIEKAKQVFENLGIEISD
jgi:uncharacterized protein